MKLPDFLIAGTCKAGTSSLYHYLIQHPKILPSLGNGFDAYLGNKEIRFFDRYWRLGIDWYKSRFPHTDPGQITGEASPEYMSRTLCFDRAKQVLSPKTKIVLIIRDPVDRLHSHFYHMVNLIPGWKDKYASFEDFWHGCREEDNYMIEMGLYDNFIPMWQGAFNTFILRAEHMFNHTQQAVDEIHDFLGVDHNSLPKFDKLRESGKPEYLDPDLRQEIMDFYIKYDKWAEILYRK